MFWQKRKVNLAGQKIDIVPMSAKDGLATVIELAGILKKAVPYLVILSDRSRQRRIAAMAVMLSEIDGLSDVLFNVVANGTGLDRQVVEDEVTIAEFTRALTTIMRVNDWHKLWQVAVTLQIVEQTSLVDFVVTRLGKLRTR